MSSIHNLQETKTNHHGYFPNADDVLQELDEYFKLEDTTASSSNPSSILDFSQISGQTELGTGCNNGGSSQPEINLEQLSTDQLQTVV